MSELSVWVVFGGCYQPRSSLGHASWVTTLRIYVAIDTDVLVTAWQRRQRRGVSGLTRGAYLAGQAIEALACFHGTRIRPAGEPHQVDETSEGWVALQDPGSPDALV